MEAIKALEKEGIRCDLINIHTIKPLDEQTILASIEKTGCVVTAEEHQIHGGLGDMIAGLLSRHHPVPQEFVAVNDSFGESGKPDELLAKYGLGPSDIIKAIKKVHSRKI
jgi:transketolase